MSELIEDFKTEVGHVHTCDPTDAPDKNCKGCQQFVQEQKRLEREES